MKGSTAAVLVIMGLGAVGVYLYLKSKGAAGFSVIGGGGGSDGGGLPSSVPAPNADNGAAGGPIDEYYANQTKAANDAVAQGKTLPVGVDLNPFSASEVVVSTPGGASPLAYVGSQPDVFGGTQQIYAFTNPLTGLNPYNSIGGLPTKNGIAEVLPTGAASTAGLVIETGTPTDPAHAPSGGGSPLTPGAPGYSSALDAIRAQTAQLSESIGQPAATVEAPAGKPSPTNVNNSGTGVVYRPPGAQVAI